MCFACKTWIDLLAGRLTVSLLFGRISIEPVAASWFIRFVFHLLSMSGFVRFYEKLIVELSNPKLPVVSAAPLFER